MTDKAKAQKDADRFRAKRTIGDIPLDSVRMTFLIEHLIADYEIVRAKAHLSGVREGLEAAAKVAEDCDCACECDGDHCCHFCCGSAISDRIRAIKPEDVT